MARLKPDTPDAENPEWEDADFVQAQNPVKVPALAKVLRPGRPQLPAHERKQRVTMYLDRDILEVLRKDGRGWQTRANETLRMALGLKE